MARTREADQCLTRKDVLQALAGLTLMASLRPSLALADGGAVTIEVAPGMYVHQGRHALSNPENQGDIANATIVAGRDCVAIIDTSASARMGTALRDAARSISAKPIRYVINTHMHPDHVLGNAAFEADKPQFVAHHKMARGLSARTQRYLETSKEALGATAFEGTKIILPTVEVKDRLDLDLGGRTLSLQARPTAHTDNDLTIHDSATETLILGDLLFSGHVPTLDGSIKGWIALIDAMSRERAARVIPGHGPASMPWPDGLQALARYLTTVAAGVRAGIAAGKTINDAIADVGQSEKAAWLMFDEFHARNVTAAFAELEWE